MPYAADAFFEIRFNKEASTPITILTGISLLGISWKKGDKKVDSRNYKKILAQELMHIPGVKSVAQQIGRANLSEDTWGTNISEVWISLTDNL